MAARLEGISSLSWEHPADRAALNTLRAIPGFDEIVRRVAGFFGDRGVRNLFLANAVLVGPQQRPRLHGWYREMLAALDWPGATGADVPPLYVTQTPLVNAGAVGFERPVIVLNSSLLELLNEREQQFIVAHELGHVMSGHVTYRTIALIVLMIGVTNLPFLAGLALLPFQLALLEWYRKAELSCDRAGLLGVQAPRVAYKTFMEMAGGTRPGAAEDDTMDLDAFMAQAAEYESQTGTWDNVLKLVNTAMRDHPFNTVRAAELQRWVASGDYDRILAGDYRRRGGGDAPPLSSDYKDAASYYGEQFRSATEGLRDTLGRAKDAFTDAVRRKREP
jgi:Zn-dependent protease with chaperone function